MVTVTANPETVSWLSWAPIDSFSFLLFSLFIPLSLLPSLPAFLPLSLSSFHVGHGSQASVYAGKTLHHELHPRICLASRKEALTSLCLFVFPSPFLLSPYLCCSFRGDQLSWLFVVSGPSLFPSVCKATSWALCGSCSPHLPQLTFLLMMLLHVFFLALEMRARYSPDQPFEACLFLRTCVG